MNTKLNQMIINAEYKQLFSFKDNEEMFVHNAQMISYRILSEVEKLCSEQKINKKQLSEMLGTSKSYITQLFSGKKSINTYTMAKLEHILNMRFEIELKLNEEQCDQLSSKISTDILLNKKIYMTKAIKDFYSYKKGTEEIVNKLESDNKQIQQAA